MPGLGTIINALAIIIAGIVGIGCQRILTPAIQKNVLQAIGISVIFVGVIGTIANSLVYHHGQFNTQGSIASIVALALGVALGTWWDLDGKFNHLGIWLRHKVNRDHDSRFIDGFITASLTVIIGAMGIVGAFQDGLDHNLTTLITKSIIDFITIAMLSATFGVGPLFSAFPLAIYQLTMTYLAVILKPLLSATMITGISLVGSMIIACIGLNLAFDTKIKVANYVPALIIVVIYLAFWPL